LEAVRCRFHSKDGNDRGYGGSLYSCTQFNIIYIIGTQV
jgi:hypothetical protein